MPSFLRQYFNISGEESVMAATNARLEQKEKLQSLTEQRDALKQKVAENTVLGEKYKKAVNERLNQRATVAGPALDDYDSISLGKIIYDQLGQHVAKLTDMLSQAVSNDLANYGYRSKQFFSMSITADALSGHLRNSIGGSSLSWSIGSGNQSKGTNKKTDKQQQNQSAEATSGSALEPFDHLVIPLINEMSDTQMNPVCVTPLLEFAHEGCLGPKQVETSVLLLRENLSKHKGRVGGTYSSGQRVNWESILDLLKFTSFSASFSDSARNKKVAMSLVEQADECAERIEMTSRQGHWQDCLKNVDDLWTILAPTIRSYAAAGGNHNNNNNNNNNNSSEGDDEFSLSQTSVPLLKSIFDVRNAVEQRLAVDFYLDYVSALKISHQHAFTSKLFEMESSGGAPSLPKQL